MSSFTTGGGSDFDRLIALATFLSSPEYLERAKSLRDAIAESEQIKSDAKDAIAEAEAAVKAAKAEADMHAAEKRAFEAEREQHRADMTRREAAMDARFVTVQADKRKLSDEQAEHRTAVAAFSRTKTKMEGEFASREAALSTKESSLRNAVAAHNRRVAALNRAMSDED